MLLHRDMEKYPGKGLFYYNVDNDPQKIFRKIYDVASEYVQQSSIPQLILILADYQYKSAFAADQELNLVACLTEVMVECQFN